MVSTRNCVLFPLLASCVVMGKCYGHWPPVPFSKLEMGDRTRLEANGRTRCSATTSRRVEPILQSESRSSR